MAALGHHRAVIFNAEYTDWPKVEGTHNCVHRVFSVSLVLALKKSSYNIEINKIYSALQFEVGTRHKWYANNHNTSLILFTPIFSTPLR